MGNMKMKLFYAHDDTLSFMLNSLNVYEGLTDVPPPYASGLILELYQDENAQYRWSNESFGSTNLRKAN